MGCDIHLHIEIKINDEWYHWNQPDIERNYELFTKMAGVRSCSDEIEPLSLPKGLPSDVTPIVIFHSMYQGTDGHSHSYLASEEVEELADWVRTRLWGRGWWFEKTFGHLFGNAYKSLHKCPADYPGSLRDYRFVFWFDN